MTALLLSDIHHHAAPDLSTRKLLLQMLAEQKELASQMQQLQQGFTTYMDASAAQLEALRAQLAEQSNSNGSSATRASLLAKSSNEAEQQPASTPPSVSFAAPEADKNHDAASEGDMASQQRLSMHAKASEASDTQTSEPRTLQKGVSRKDAAEGGETDAEALENQSRADDPSKAAADAIQLQGKDDDSEAAGDTRSASSTANVGMTGQADDGLEALGASPADINDQQAESTVEASGSGTTPDSLKDRSTEMAGSAEAATAEATTAKGQSSETLAEDA